MMLEVHHNLMRAGELVRDELERAITRPLAK